jgi:uncharacterized membrane protein
VGLLVGDNVYSATGIGETRSARIARGKTTTFRWRIQNDGALTDRLGFKGRGDSRSFTVRFFYMGANMTKAVVAGTYAKSLLPGASLTITVRITVAANAYVGTVRSERLRAKSMKHPVDVVNVRPAPRVYLGHTMVGRR